MTARRVAAIGVASLLVAAPAHAGTAGAGVTDDTIAGHDADSFPSSGYPAFADPARTKNLGVWDGLRLRGTDFVDRVKEIARDGNSELYLSGYAYHGRHTYTPDHLETLNEKAWGLGYGKSLINARGDEESLYFLTITDSHEQPQPMLGYAYQWRWQLHDSPLSVGAGLTGMLMSRQDYYGGFPFPVALPVASFGNDTFRLMASYVPRLSVHKNNGDVLLVFFRIAL